MRGCRMRGRWKKIWTDLDGSALLASYLAKAEENKSHWIADKTIIREQARLIANLMSEVAPKS